MLFVFVRNTYVCSCIEVWSFLRMSMWQLYSLCVWPPSTALHLEDVVELLSKGSDLRIANWFQKKKRMFEEYVNVLWVLVDHV